MLKPTDGAAAKRSHKAETEILRRGTRSDELRKHLELDNYVDDDEDAAERPLSRRRWLPLHGLHFSQRAAAAARFACAKVLLLHAPRRAGDIVDHMGSIPLASANICF